MLHFLLCFYTEFLYRDEISIKSLIHILYCTFSFRRILKLLLQIGKRNSFYYNSLSDPQKVFTHIVHILELKILQISIQNELHTIFLLLQQNLPNKILYLFSLSFENNCYLFFVNKIMEKKKKNDYFLNMKIIKIKYCISDVSMLH